MQWAEHYYLTINHLIPKEAQEYDAAFVGLKMAFKIY
jgi:hypothetical protein